MPKPSVTDLDAELVYETDKAYLFDFGGKEPQWVPKSVCEWDEASSTVTISIRWATENGLI